MKFPNNYKVLKKNYFSFGEYHVIPIRYEDRIDIMNWRNDQLYHLRQNSRLEKTEQDDYFKNVIQKIFSENEPDQLLFSFFRKNSFIGYGGLVHLNWEKRNGEISFVMNSLHEKKNFNKYWDNFLKIIEVIAFDELKFNKIYTCSYPLRPKLYVSLKKNKFRLEKIILNNTKIDSEQIDLLIHYKINKKKIILKEVDKNDKNQLFIWANDKIRLKYSFNNNPITWSEHNLWFQNKINSESTKFYLLREGKNNLGQIRFDFKKKTWGVDYFIDPRFRGKGYGTLLLQLGLERFSKGEMIEGIVKNQNKASLKVFENLLFKKKINASENLTIFNLKIS